MKRARAAHTPRRTGRARLRRSLGTRLMASVNTRDYYLEYFGHDVRHLRVIHNQLRGSSSRPCIFLAGDSSLDNKVWFENRADALNGYEAVLNPPYMKLCARAQKRSSRDWPAPDCSRRRARLFSCAAMCATG